MKICSTCNIEKATKEYYTSKHSKDGLKSQCKSCHRQSQIKWNTKNPERVKFLEDRWRKNNRDKVYAKSKRHIDKTGNLYNERRLLRKVFTGYKVGSKPHQLLGVEQHIALAHLLKTWEERYGRKLQTTDKKHIDHILPVSKGGTHYYKNLQLLTPSDNSRKGVTLPK